MEVLTALQEVDPQAAREIHPETSLDEIEADDLDWALSEWLHRIDAHRAETLSALRVRSPTAETNATRRIEGDFLLLVLSRSLGTGEAEIASRGFFDIMDRPPAAFWLAVTRRPAPQSAERIDRAVITFVPKDDLARVEAGVAACPNGSLAWLCDAAPALFAQVSNLVDRIRA